MGTLQQAPSIRQHLTPTKRTYQTIKMKFLFAIFVVACAVAAANAECQDKLWRRGNKATAEKPQSGICLKYLENGRCEKPGPPGRCDLPEEPEEEPEEAPEDPELCMTNWGNECTF